MESKSATIRQAFNTINNQETFTPNLLAEVSEMPIKDVCGYIYIVKKKGLCTVHNSDNKEFVYRKIKDDTAKPRPVGRKKDKKNKVSKKHYVNKVQYKNLEFNVEGTDAEIVDKLVPFANKLKQMVIELSDKLNILIERNKELLSDNSTLQAEVDEYRRNVPKLQEEVAKYRHIKALRTVKI